MVQVLRPALQAIPVTVHSSVTGARSRLALELRVVAEDLAGRVDRDELTLDEEIRLNDALDDAVEAVLPEVLDLLEFALSPRVEALPLHARLTLTRARGRREYGLD
jgi:hypothetical protein